jgi:hypothetical protein
MPRPPSATSNGAAAVSPSRRLAGAVLGTFAVVVPARTARAYNTEIDASAAAQYYTLSSPYGEPELRSRRYTSTLGMSLYDLTGDTSPSRPTLSFRSRLRLDADLGQDPAERDPNSTRYVPGLEQAPLDLMYAYLEGERYLDGSLGFRLGRQYVADVLGWWSFDGAEVTLAAPAYVRLEAYAGFEQRSGLPLLATPRYRADGVASGSRDDLRSNQWTGYLEESKLAPALGVALETADLGWLHARVTYRRVTNRDNVVVSPFLDPSGKLSTYSADRVSTEKVGGSLRLSPLGVGSLSGSVVYDFYAGIVSHQALALDVFPTARLSLGADYERLVPTFDGDSVFNWFSHSAITTLKGRADWAVTRRFDAALSFGSRLYETLGDPATYASQPDQELVTREVDPFATLGGRYRYNAGSVSLRGQAEGGGRGHRVGADLTSKQLWKSGYYDSLVILSLYDFADELRPDRYATSFTYVLGLGMRPNALGTTTRLGVEWEHSMNRLVGQRYRMLATLDLSVFR